MRTLKDCGIDELTGIPLYGEGGGRPTKRFNLDAVLTVTTGRLLCNMESLYDILNWVTGDNLMTHAIPRALQFAKPWVLAAHPQLAQVDMNDKALAQVGVDGFLDVMKKDFGESFFIPCFSTYWEKRNPLDELLLMRIPPTEQECMPIEEMTPQARLQHSIFSRATQGKGATLEQAVKVFADPGNWQFEHIERNGKVTGGAWVWRGNWIPPYEFAQHALNELQRSKNDKS